MDKKIPLIKKSDAVIIVAVFAIALLSLILLKGNSTGSTAVITYNDTVKTIDLKTQQDTVFTVGDTVIEVKNHEIFFKESSCHDKLCIGFGHLPKEGSFAACIPCRVTIEIKDDKKDIDAFAY